MICPYSEVSCNGLDVGFQNRSKPVNASILLVNFREGQLRGQWILVNMDMAQKGFSNIPNLYSQTAPNHFISYDIPIIALQPAFALRN